MRRLTKRELIIRRRSGWVMLMLDADVLAHWRASGKGWQTRMAQVLAAAAPPAKP